MNETTEIARLYTSTRKALLDAHAMISRVETILNQPRRWLMDYVISNTSAFIAADKAIPDRIV